MTRIKSNKETEVIKALNYLRSLFSGSGNGRGRVMKDKFAAGDYGYIAIVTDTEGNAIGLHSLQ